MDPTPEELREIELSKKYDSQNLVDSLAEHHLFADTLLYLHEAIVEQQAQIKYWQKHSEILFYKFVFHGLTLHQILSGLKLSSVYYKNEVDGKSTIDISSGKAILRAHFEAFLMYHHIYVNPVDDDLKELRYNAWIYSSLKQRQDFPAKTAFAKRQKSKNLIEINRMKETIQKLKSFQSLSTKQQHSLLNTGSGKLFSHWNTILKETGFLEGSRFNTMYTLLSAYAHSEGLSMIQLGYHPEMHQNSISQAKFDLHNSKVLICLMIDSIMELNEVVKKKYETLPHQLKHDIKMYSLMVRGGKI